MANQKIRIKLKAYECNLIDQSAEKIVVFPMPLQRVCRRM